MNTLKGIMDSVLDVTREGDLDIVRRIVQKKYYDLCQMRDWVALRRSKQYTFTGAERLGELAA